MKQLVLHYGIEQRTSQELFEDQVKLMALAAADAYADKLKAHAAAAIKASKNGQTLEAIQNVRALGGDHVLSMAEAIRILNIKEAKHGI